MECYNLELDDVFSKLNCQIEGLSNSEVEKRIEKHGLNQLVEKKKKSTLMLFFGQFKDFMIIILGLAAVLSGLFGDYLDTVIILIIIILNALVGFYQEYKAEKALEALKKMSIANAQVKREGRKQIISSDQLVPGDIIYLEAGNNVPADIRLFEVHSLKIDESTLIGESARCAKLIASYECNPAFGRR